jgi:WD40 repeat protein
MNALWDVGCGMWDVGCGMWDVGCGMYDIPTTVYTAREVTFWLFEYSPTMWLSFLVAATVIKCTLPSHSSWVTDVSWSRSNAHHLLSSSHDGHVKLWDVRSTIPLHSTKPPPQGGTDQVDEKLLCVDWLSDRSFAAGEFSNNNFTEL